MTIHILGVPHTQLTTEYLRCAYTMKAFKLCKMLVKEGMSVYVYGGEDNDTPAELVTCITKKQLSRLGYNGPEDYLKNDYDVTKPLWIKFHQRAIHEIGQRIEKGDLIGTFSGQADRSVKEAFPKNRFVELGIGYTGVFADFRIYESYAWMHFLLGVGGGAGTNGRNYDCVIPNYFDPNDFPLGEQRDNYYLFMGRMIQRKGVQIIDEIAKRMPDSRFVMAGQGAKQTDKIVCDDKTVLTSKNIEYIGVVGVDMRAELMSHARALICPTIYLPPFEGVHVEAMMCGTPVITASYGAFAETFTHGVHGFRCKNIKQYVEAAHNVDSMDYKSIQEYAQSRYSMDVVAKQYIEYFELLAGLDRGGFYEI